jgi:hypothetical protein
VPSRTVVELDQLVRGVVRQVAGHDQLLQLQPVDQPTLRAVDLGSGRIARGGSNNVLFVWRAEKP